jgi:serine/threonine-protein kinase
MLEMADTRRVQTRITTPSELTTTAGQRVLPEDLLRQASRRLGVACLVAMGLWVSNLLVFRLVVPFFGWTPTPGHVIPGISFEIVVAIFVAISLGLYAYSRRASSNARFLLDLGLFYQFLNAAGIAYLNHWAFQAPNDEHGVSWVVVIILIFPVLVPSLPKFTAIAAFACAVTDPITWLAWMYAQGDIAPLSDTIPRSILLHLANFLCAGVAVVISHIITGLGHQVTRARELGSYELGELLGGGGMGEVWRANHRLLARPAAIKLIRPERLGCKDSRSTMVIQERFKREARAAASLRSPHTIDLFDFGISSDGTFYYVMELLAGFDLDQLVRRYGPVDPYRVIHILRQACDSLAEAHHRGLVHRDIKPANIYLCRMGLQHDFVKVLDFGLVKSDDRFSDQTLLTSPEVTTGTPAFMAPEVALSEAVDGRTDIYALGCVGYWMLTGRLVFEADNAIQMVAHHLQTPPVPPSRRSELDIPPALEQIILHCLAKSPGDRPATSQQLARMLSQVNGKPAWEEEQASRWWATHAPEVEG